MRSQWIEILRSVFFLRGPRAKQEELSQEARGHYRRGNRLFDSQAWDLALAEWRRAGDLWRAAESQGRWLAGRLLNLRAAFALLVTVFVVYWAIFSLFPRNPWELIMLSGAQDPNRPWWERFLDTGRPQQDSSHKIGVREWWESLRRRLQRREGRGIARNRLGRPKIDERWEDLLRRYGRWGPLFHFQLDYNLISGYGLSRLGDYQNALQVFEKGLAASESSEKKADLYQGIANAHYFEGYQLQPDGLARYDMAMVKKSLEAYRRSVALEPRAVSYGNLGWMYFLTGNYDRAVDMSKQALAMDPTLEYVHLNLGLVYLVQDRVYKAFEVYRKFMERDPPKQVYLGGINDLREVVRDQPGRYPFAQLMIGLLSMKQARYGQAREALSRFRASPFVTPAWRQLAKGLLDDMNKLDPAQ